MTDSFDIRNCFASLSPSGQHPLRGAGCLLSLCSPAGCLRQANIANIATYPRGKEPNRTESRTLATLRDTLLPKLLSGELGVSELQPTAV